MTGRRERERGSGSLLMIGVAGVVALMLAGAMVLVSAVHAGTRARTAADLAALGAADLVLNPAPGESPCARAARLAVANGGVLVTCRTSADDVVVLVRVPSSAPGLGPAAARSRAGLSPGGAAGLTRGPEP